MRPVLLCASCLALSAAPSLAAEPLGSKPKWVPLGQTEAQPKPEAVTPTQPSAAPVAVAQTPVATPPVTSASEVPATASAVGPRPLQLTCLGAGTASKVTGAAIFGYGGSASIIGHKDRGFEDQVDIRLFNGDDRIRLPRTMLPGIHGGEAGWFKLHDVVADARSIRASAGVNAFNNPKIFIDRVTGTISISGKAGDYAGQCQVIDANAAPKF